MTRKLHRVSLHVSGYRENIKKPSDFSKNFITEKNNNRYLAGGSYGSILLF